MLAAVQSPHLNLDDFPDSPYAAELRRWPRLTFGHGLEPDYVQRHLERVHGRARLWTTLLFVLSLALTAEQMQTDGIAAPATVAHLALLLPMCAVLGWIAWTEAYARWYLPVTRVVGPILYVLTGVFAAEAISGGATEDLAVLVLAVVSAFFFVGLLYRTAVATAVATFIAFAAATVAFGVDRGLLLKCLTILLVAGWLAAMIARDVEHSYRKRFLEEALIAELLERDALTGLKNRRAFEERGRAAWQVAERDKQPLAVLFVDVDYFKRYNDEYGHQAGDTTLKRVAAVVRAMARRPLDVAARFGGEEFAVVLYGTGPAAAGEIADDLRRRVEALCIEHRASLCGSAFVTVSVGVAAVQPQGGRSFEGALQLADQALYRAKSAGRNRVIVESGDAYEQLVTGVYEKLGAVANG
ncbi:MAG TPA: GGDEF domain-containing protein [Gammaproteobacteria bacterium]